MIGEKMARVKGYARKHGHTHYAGRGSKRQRKAEMRQLRRQFRRKGASRTQAKRRAERVRDRLDREHNRKWIREKLAAGYKVVDRGRIRSAAAKRPLRNYRKRDGTIGVTQRGRSMSPAYRMELREVLRSGTRGYRKVGRQYDDGGKRGTRSPARDASWVRR